MSVSVNEAKRRARDLIARAGIFRPPVPVEDIARNYGVSVQIIALDDELSGMALIRDGHRIIIANKNHHKNRRRFTLAHELAHHVLHYEYLMNSVHVDKAILRRDIVSSTGVDVKERAANAFAAELLMPKAMIEPYLHKGLDFHNEAVVKSVAQAFEVSTAALHYRLFFRWERQRELPLK